jgi:hypothetical protein
MQQEQVKAFGSLSTKLLAHDVIFGGPDGKSRAQQIQAATGISYNKLSNGCNPNQVHQFTQDEVAAISNASGDYRLVEDLCRKCGGTFKRFEEETEVHHTDIKDTEESVFELIGHIGRLADSYKSARRDNRISPHECSAMDRMLLMIREGAVELSEKLNRLVK